MWGGSRKVYTIAGYNIESSCRQVHLDKPLVDMLHLQLFFSERVGVMNIIGLVKAPFLGVDTLLHSPNAYIKASWTSFLYRNMVWNDFTNYVTSPLFVKFIIACESHVVVFPWVDYTLVSSQTRKQINFVILELPLRTQIFLWVTFHPLHTFVGNSKAQSYYLHLRMSTLGDHFLVLPHVSLCLSSIKLERLSSLWAESLFSLPWCLSLDFHFLIFFGEILFLQWKHVCFRHHWNVTLHLTFPSTF
jgi:hypothetical protein